ncbi:MAG: hypothetical protein A2036_03190 [Omnitrophica bacterium GWA2_50_21]|nr:MAG: hypothetical protein A2036_03190 [Omnitrophica bacterium GWA2_50_21]
MTAFTQKFHTTFLSSLLAFFTFFFATQPAQLFAMGKKPFVEKSIPKTFHIKNNEVAPVPLNLEDCYQLALKRSETIAISNETVNATQADFLAAASEAIGDADFVMNYRRQKVLKSGEGSSVGGTFNAPNRRDREFVISQPLFQGFKALGAIQGAGSLKKQRVGEKKRAEQLLFLDVAKAFYDVLMFQKDVETIQGIRDLFEERMADLNEREKIGRSRRSEIVTAESRMRIIDSELAQAKGTLAVAKHILEFLVGIPVDSGQLKDMEIFEIEPETMDVYLAAADKRPDVEAAEQAVKTAWNGVVVAQSGLWPDISLVNNQYQKRDGFQDAIDWDLLFKINVPLYRGGETLGKIKSATSAWKKAKLFYSLARRQAELDIKEAYQTWVASRNEYQALEKAVKSSEENFQLQKEDYSQNLVNNLDVLSALESLHETRREANRAKYELKENYWNLKTAMGKTL